MPVRRRSLYHRRRFEALESRRLLVAEGEAFMLSRSVDTAGLVGAISSTVQWGDGSTSAGVVSDSDATGPLRVVFDYSLDTSGFFADGSRRQVLQAAADSLVSRFTDDLSAIQPSGSNTWSPAIYHPRTQAQYVLPSSLSIPANQILIYVGARNLPGNQVGEGAGGYYTTAQGSQAWLDTVRSRGEAGALLSAPTDIGPWGGSLAFDEPRDWYFGLDADGMGSGQNDFFSVAVHELAHVLGFGVVYPGSTTSSWERLVQGNQFIGPQSRAEYGGNVPLASGSHWQNGLQSDGRETAMDPSLTTGQRKLLTPLDLAAMDDIGWSVSDTRATVAAQHTYGDDGSYPLVVTLTGSRGGEFSYQDIVAISNATPQVTAAADQLVVVGQPLAINDVVTISDAGFRVLTTSPPTAETFAVTIAWGDGTPDETRSATIDQHGNANRPTLASLDATHTYAQLGTYTVRVTVRDDDGGQASDTFRIEVTAPPQLTLQLDRSAIDEDAGGGAATLTVTRTGPTQTTAQTLSLSSSDPGEASLVASAVIPAGQRSVSVPVAAVDDTLLDGPQSVALSASGNGLETAAIDLIVRDVESLAATFNVAQTIEDAAAGALALTVRRSNTDLDEAVAVTLSGGDATQLLVPTTIQIPAGQAAVSVPVEVLDDAAAEPPRSLTYTVAAAGYQGSSATIDVLDDEPPYFQNLLDIYDVDNNQRVEPYDLLVIINRLNRAGSVDLDPQDGLLDGKYVDVSGDYLLSPLDANLLNNELNRRKRL
ncbi:PKD domain-containing protein [Roseimaritima ulvae]|uniref:PKD domain protein n=1 Tax=Roseimaritima ulvae TaxID=980254 RepID=A0A5B9R1M2_9BACT|nr:PKD domain-containing protein [Roseimaritima ulvae]QEG43306.1 PKD domain protein [Roseimaritima ulvae]